MSRQPQLQPGQAPPPPPLDTSSFLPLTSAGDDVTFPLVGDDTGHGDQEATLEALRAAFSESHEDHPGATADATGTSVPATLQSSSVDVVPHHQHHTAEPDLAPPTLVPAATVHAQSLDKAVAQLQQLSANNQAIVDQVDAQRILQGLIASYRLLSDGHRRQAELVKNIVASIESRGPPTIDPAFAVAYVPRSEYDALKARYDVLLSTSGGMGSGAGGSGSGGAGSSRRARMPKSATLDDAAGGVADVDRLRETGSATPFNVDDDKRLVRKRRSMKLEHLVHKMANRRLGVEYPVSSFESKGSRDLPAPDSAAPMAAESINGVDEYRPDFRADVSSNTVRPFLDVVIADCKNTWAETYSAEEPEVDEDQIVKAVHTYWTRLGKRYDEQLTRERGEVHKDEITRRKQNQYRRQQSLVARRAAAFDSSPLNLCKLRALYRTLLTIDFAAMTNERPDPKREYTEDEWNAYRKLQCGARSQDAHEVVDQFWLSSNARMLLNTLDVYSLDQSTKMRRKGRPKQPAPTFHLPQELWDRSNLPLLRPKDAHGLPISGAGGIILFRFHVDDKVQETYPDWAEGLYDNPPVAEEDRLLPNLTDVMGANAFYHLKPRIRAAREAGVVARLSEQEVQDVLARSDAEAAAAAAAAAGVLDETAVAAAAVAAAAGAASAADADAAGFDLATADFMSARGLESIVALAASQGHLVNAFAAAATAAAPPSPAGAAHHTPPPGGHPFSAASLHAAHALLPYDIVSPAAAAAAAAAVGAAGGVGAGTGAGAAGAHGPSPGSSVRARRQAKRMMSEVPGGAATPVPRKRRRGEVEAVGVGVAAGGGAGTPGEAEGGEAEEVGDDGEAEIDLSGDASFLDTL